MELTPEGKPLQLLSMARATGFEPLPGARCSQRSWIRNVTHTTTPTLSFDLFLYEAEGLLKEADCPEALIGGALERAQAKEIEELTDLGIEELGENGTRIKKMKTDLRGRSESGSRGEGNAKRKRKEKKRN